jgi:hypothetical protein
MIREAAMANIQTQSFKVWFIWFHQNRWEYERQTEK